MTIYIHLVVKMENEKNNKKSSNTISVSITPIMKEYLNKHPNLKQSTIFQNAMNRIMNKKRNPLMLIMGVLGVCFGVMCIAITASGILLYFGIQGFLLGAILFCIGCAVLTASVLIFYKDRK